MSWDPWQLQHNQPTAWLTQIMDKEEITPCSNIMRKQLDSEEAINNFGPTDVCSGPAGLTTATGDP